MTFGPEVIGWIEGAMLLVLGFQLGYLAAIIGPAGRRWRRLRNGRAHRLVVREREAEHDR